MLIALALFVSAVAQVSLVVPPARAANVVVLGASFPAGVGACGNGTDGEQRPNRNPSRTYWAENATNLTINFGNVGYTWTMAIVQYANVTGPIPNGTNPLPPQIGFVEIRGAASVNETTNNTAGNYLLRDYYFPVAAAGACRPNTYACALQVQLHPNPPLTNNTIVTCSDVRIYSKSFDQVLTITATTAAGVAPPDATTMLGRFKNVYGTKGFLDANTKITPPTGEFTTNSDGSFTFTITISDAPGFQSDDVAALITADVGTTLVDTLGVASVKIGGPPDDSGPSAGQTAAIVIIVLLLVFLFGGLAFIYFKRPDLWKSMCAKCSCSCPKKGTDL